MARLERKEVTMSSGYAGIRQLTPYDDIVLAKWLGDQKEDNVLVNNSIVAMGIEWVEEPIAELTSEEYLIPHPTQPDNFIEIDDLDAKKDKNGNYPKKQISDPFRPKNYVVDKTKVIRKTFPPAKSLEDLMQRMSLSGADWYVITEASARLNEPNPVLLGK